MNSYGLYVILALTIIVTTIILIIAYWRKYCKRIQGSQIQTRLMFKIGAISAQAVLLPVQIIHALPADLRIYAIAEEILDMHCVGIFNPKLVFQWQGRILDTFSDCQIPIRNEVTLTYVQASILRQILRQRHSFDVMWENQGNLVPAEIITDRNKIECKERLKIKPLMTRRASTVSLKSHFEGAELVRVRVSKIKKC